MDAPEVSVVSEHYYSVGGHENEINNEWVDTNPYLGQAALFGATGAGVIKFPACERTSLDSNLDSIQRLSGATLTFEEKKDKDAGGSEAIKIAGDVHQIQLARDAVFKVLWNLPLSSPGQNPWLGATMRSNSNSSSFMNESMFTVDERKKTDKKVNWRPWGEAAFRLAEKYNKPIILSIVYSPSTRCNAVDATTFKDDSVVNLLEDSFVCIKVDRDERPDITQVCLKKAHHFNGWPFIVHISHDGKPILHMPSTRPSLLESSLRIVKKNWDDPYRKDVFISGGTDNFLRRAALPMSVSSTRLQINAMVLCRKKLTLWDNLEALRSAWEFPKPVEIHFMLYYLMMERAWKSEEDFSAFKEVSETLHCMAMSSIHDHIGGGFHTIGSRFREIAGRCRADCKYSLDLVPDFEKMLYEQVQLASVYLDAFSLTNDGLYSCVSRDILDFLRRDMIGVGGQIFSALQADGGESESSARTKEGSFYQWTTGEVEDILGKQANLFMDHYDLKPSVLPLMSNPDNELSGMNVLKERTDSRVDLCILGDCRKKLFDVRSRRPCPVLDDRVIVSWNGLAISSFARASIILKREAEGTKFYFPVKGCNLKEYMEVAKDAASFIWLFLYDETCGLKHSLSEESGFLEDYAFLISGLLDLYEYGGETKWLKWATVLQDTQDKLFLDREGGGYFTHTIRKKGDGSLVDGRVDVRVKEDHDHDVPSGNSVSAINLLRLASMMGDERSHDYRNKANHLLAAFAKMLTNTPTAVPLMCCAAHMSSLPTDLVVLVGLRHSVEFDKKLTAAHEPYNPNRRVIHIDPTNIDDLSFWLMNNKHVFQLVEDNLHFAREDVFTLSI